MSAAANESSAAIPVTLTFDQYASAPVANMGPLATGTYKPAAYNSPIFTNFSLSPSSNTNLSVFAGAPVNGLWHLYAYDGATGDHGAISNGWGLAITTIAPVNQIADLGVTIAASPSIVFPGGNVTYTMTVTNSSTNATYVFLTNVLGANLSFVPNSISPYPPSQTSQTATNQTQIYNTNGILAGHANLILSFLATVATNLQTNTVLNSVVTVGSSLIDPNTNNNTASASVALALQAEVSAAISSSATAGAVIMGSNVVYALAVTNNGPDVALNVVGVLTQSLTGATNPVFTNYFGSLVPGSNATVSFSSNAPAAPGLLTNTWAVSTGSTNLNPGLGIATSILNVTYPEPVIAANGASLLSASFVPSNGAASPIEIVTAAFTLKNIGAAPATNLTATLLSTNGVIPSSTASLNYGAIAVGASASKNFTFTNTGVPGSAMTAVLSLADNGYSLGTVSFTLANSTPLSLSFANTAQIIIPDSGPGSPYPSEIDVSTANLVIGKVTATLQGFTHSYPHDVNVLLIGPSGQQAVLMAHAGGPYSVSGLALAFDDTSTNSLTEAILVPVTNHPTLIPPQDTYPGLSGQPSNTNLSVFIGGNPNGLWSLYVYDDTPGNDGSIAGGWTLGLTLINPINLGVGMTHEPDPVLTGNFLDFQITVTNLGPAGATNVLLTDTLPAGARLVSAAASQGPVNTNVAGVVSFNLGILANASDTATATLQVEPLQAGTALNSAVATNANGSPASAANTVTVIPAAPFFLQATNISQDLRLTLEGSAGQNYILQVSTNLTTWTSLSTNTATGIGVFTLTNGFTNGPARFYRALHLPQ